MSRTDSERLRMLKRTLLVMALLFLVAISALAQMNCLQRKAHLLYPADGATRVGAARTNGPVVLFTWSPVKNPASYDVFIGLNGAPPSARDHVIDAEFAILALAPGRAQRSVQANYDGG